MLSGFHAHRPPLSIPGGGGRRIRDHIFETFGFTVNVGISNVKVLAKMASDFEKPGKVHTLYPEEIPLKMWPLPVSDLFMVGRRSAERLKTYGIRTIGDLAHTDLSFLTAHFKSHGRLMWEFANGIDSSPVVSTRQEAKGVGNSITLSTDVTTAEAAKKVLLSLAGERGRPPAEGRQLAGTVAVELKYADFTKASHQAPTLSPCKDTDAIYRLSCSLFDQVWNGEPIRLLGIRSSRLTAEGEPCSSRSLICPWASRPPDQMPPGRTSPEHTPQKKRENPLGLLLRKS